MGRPAKYIVIAAAVVIVGSVVTPLVYLVRFAGGAGEVRREIARIKAEGGPTCAADLAGKPIPDSENAAVIYEKAFKLLPKNEPPILKRFCDRGERSKDPKLRGQVTAMLPRYAKALALAERASSMPKCRFRIDWGKSLMADTPQYDHLRFLVELAAARAMVEARGGKASAAVDSIRLVFAIGESMREEPVLISCLVRYSTIGLATDALLEAAGCCDLGGKDAKVLADSISSISLRGSASRALEGERAIVVVFYDALGKGRIDFASGDKQSSATLKRVGSNPLARIIFAKDEAYYLSEMRKQIAAAHRPYRELAQSMPKTNPNPPRFAFLSSKMLPVYARTAVAKDKAAARLAGDRIFLGLIAYRDRFGAYPTSLNELRSRLGWRVPDDPFSGKAFVYRRKGAGFVLYSIGEDLKDNGGTQPETAKASTRPSPPKSIPGVHVGDIVWKRDR
jgi:hypothetical protein